MSANPFVQKQYRLQIPPHMGKQVSVRGFTIDADADGCIEVPKDVADELAHHGIKPYEAPAEKSAKK